MKTYLPSIKIFLSVVTWFALMALLAFMAGCTKRPHYAKITDSQHRMAKVSSWHSNDRK